MRNADSTISYLDQPLATTPEILALAEPVDPREVFRFADRCVEGACQHFAQGRCGLGERVAHDLEPVVDALPRCRIRSTCRWFAEQGRAACLRCPMVVTMRVPVDERMVDVALADVDLDAPPPVAAPVDEPVHA